jgi:hypothetical protein
MKLRNNWKVKNKQWDKFQIRIRIGRIDFVSIDIDVSREFYMLTLLNFSIKNR